MLIGSRQRLSQIISDPILSIGSESIKRVSSTKTLGVMVDECITWKDHIDEVAKKAAKGIGILRDKVFLTKIRLRPFIVVWHNCSEALQNKLQKLQNRAGRIITGDGYKIASDTVRTKLCLDTLEERREKQLKTLMIQIMKCNSIAYFREFFTFCSNQTYQLTITRQHGDHARKIINSGNRNGVQIGVNYIGKSIKVEIMQFV